MANFINSELDLKIESSPFPPFGESDTIAYKERRDRKLFQVYIYLSGRSLGRVRKISYVLHSSFKNNIITVERTRKNPKASLSIWTWGLFELKAIVETIDGETIHLTHYLDYDEQVRAFPKRLRKVTS